MPTKPKTYSARVSLPLAISIAVGAIILVYVASVAYPFVSGPHLLVSAVQNEKGLFVVSGTALRVSSITVNDLPIALTDQGTFSTTLAYPPGYTVIVVRAEDRFGRSRTEQLTFVNTHYLHEREEKTNSEEEPERTSEGTEGN